ncbi:antibiotic biosynthesis monooxygenase family protein [Amycolatopsis sp. NPDC059657]|uniref:antibiotic biosynthesis monooxygenase family protein n=1 Tax=Amycolatopsis sp. NPDC059657 TaxID=3346899 RepID=UPI003670E7B8
MTEQAFRIQLTLTIHPGREDEFEKTWLEIGDAVTGHPANIGQWLARSSDEPGTFVVTSDWVSEEKFREFEHSPGHKTHREKLHPLRASGSMTTQHVLHHFAGEAAR